MEKPKYGTEERTMEFLKQAFCIDGEVKLLGKTMVKSISGDLEGLTYELTDSIRGKFFITLSR